MSHRLKDRICLITGASRGIGAAIAKAYAAEGAQVVALARTQGGLEALDTAIRAAGGLPPVLIPCDLKKLESIDQLGAALHARFGRLDVLVAGAAQMGMLGPLAQSDAKKFEQTLQLNLLANYRLIRSLDPLLRVSSAGRAVFITSAVTQSIHANWSAYAISKVALEHMVQLYAAENTSAALKVFLFDPGAVRTRLRAEAFPGEDPARLPAPDTLVSLFVAMAEAGCTRPSGARLAA
jgi:NAD(P)-dependent dehydrogenase (short-subunit alcohol dehydrogenase family)